MHVMAFRLLNGRQKVMEHSIVRRLIVISTSWDVRQRCPYQIRAASVARSSSRVRA